jgi:hypothetical protein
MKLFFQIGLLLLINLTLLGCSFGQQVVEPVVYLIPAGYMGNVYIFHNVPDGVPLKREGNARVYEISKDGILRSESPEISGLYQAQYFYLTPDGKREKITGYWNSSIHDTPENRADKTIGIFFPSTGSLSGTSSSKSDGTSTSMFNCDIRYEQFYVGTKTYLLSTPNLAKDLFTYIKENPICRQGTEK